MATIETRRSNRGGRIGDRIVTIRNATIEARWSECDDSQRDDRNVAVELRRSNRGDRNATIESR
ncbi:MAG TPA: hypothetical protein VKU19_13765 [Bryobacteraceae bacterium]|nr:hypothetical protein [Bryobacteraceae bacterium]